MFKEQSSSSQLSFCIMKNLLIILSCLIFVGCSSTSKAQSIPTQTVKFGVNSNDVVEILNARTFNIDSNTLQVIGGVVVAVGSNAVLNMTIITTNVASSPAVANAEFQSALDKGGIIWIDKFTYTFSTNLYLRVPVRIFGNDSTLIWPASLTNFALDTAGVTNVNLGPVVIRDLNFNGSVIKDYAATVGANSIADGLFAYQYNNSYWSNHSGLRIDTAGGGEIADCQFYGWSGQGVLFVNGYASDAHAYPRLIFHHNHSYSNYIGAFVSSANYNIAGYYNNDSSLWKIGYGEYTQINNNDFTRCAVGVIASAGNCQVLNNIIADNYTGLGINGGVNAAHGLYAENTINHNVFGIACEGNTGGNFIGNAIHGGTGPSMMFNNVSQIFVVGNSMSTGVIFTNNCTGVFKNNGFNGTWGGTFTTNFTGSTNLVVAGNHRIDAVGSDGSTSSALDRNVFMPQQTNAAPSSSTVVGWMVITNRADGKAYSIPLSNWP